MDIKVEFVDLELYNTNPLLYEDAIETAFDVAGIQVGTQLKHNVFFVVAFVEDNPCGVIRFTLVDGRKTVYCLRQVNVLEAYRGKGVASKMYEVGLPKLKEKGATKVLSFILQNNHASRRLHNKFGFKNTDKGSYENSYYDAYGEMDEMWVNKL